MENTQDFVKGAALRRSACCTRSWLSSRGAVEAALWLRPRAGRSGLTPLQLPMCAGELGFELADPTKYGSLIGSRLRLQLGDRAFCRTELLGLVRENLIPGPDLSLRLQGEIFPRGRGGSLEGLPLGRSCLLRLQEQLSALKRDRFERFRREAGIVLQRDLLVVSLLLSHHGVSKLGDTIALSIDHNLRLCSK